jgi:pimeloyl-[acyl-carrier protein] methyl ester esterase
MKTLALLHGWGATGAIWSCQEQQLAGKARILTPDFGCWQAGWLADWLRTLPLAHTVAVGWSLGGMLLLEALATFGLTPAAVVLVGVPAVFCRRPHHPYGPSPAAVRALRQAVKRDSKSVLEDFSRRCLAPREESFWPAVRHYFVPDQDPAFLAAGLDYLQNADLRPVLGRVKAPVTLVQGDADAIVPPAQAQRLQTYLPGSQLVVLPGAGHLPFLTQAGVFAEILNQVAGED